MISLLKKIFDQYFFLWVFLLSFSLSPWCYHPWYALNGDGVLYLQLADKIYSTGISSAFHHYDWPFFSIVIASFHQLTQLSYATSAYLLEAIFMGFSAVFFVKIVARLSYQKTLAYLALLIFLTFTALIGYRGNIFRDIGYWTFYLSGAYYFLSFIEEKKITFALLWFFSLLVACLFRVEGIILLLLTPCLCFFLPARTWGQKIQQAFRLYLPGLVLAGLALILLAYLTWQHPFYLQQGHQSITDVFTTHGDVQSLPQKFYHLADNFKNNVLPKTAKPFSAELILFFGLSAYFMIKLLLTLGILNSVLIISVGKYGLCPANSVQKRALLGLFLITVLLPYSFMLSNGFINTRYLMTAAFTLLLFAPFGLEACLRNLQTKTRHLNKACLLFLILYAATLVWNILYLGSTVFYKNSWSYTVQASTWLDAHKKQLPQLCGTDGWAIFPVVGPHISPDNVDNQLSRLLQPGSPCLYLVFVETPVRQARLARVLNDQDWQVYQHFTSRKKFRSIYVFQRKSALTQPK